MYTVKGSNDTTTKTQAVKPFAAQVDGHRTPHDHTKNERSEPMANETTYTQVGDYLIPNIALTPIPTEEKDKPLGRYARLHWAYLREHKPITYNRLLLTERLFPLLREIDEAAQTRLETIADREAAHEIILAELVYN
jgi:hypothetical protein